MVVVVVDVVVVVVVEGKVGLLLLIGGRILRITKRLLRGLGRLRDTLGLRSRLVMGERLGRLRNLLREFVVGVDVVVVVEGALGEKGAHPRCCHRSRRREEGQGGNRG